ncbi:MAG: hypothetical protein ACOC4M_11215 [Promethearchaeia archaeon]
MRKTNIEFNYRIILISVLLIIAVFLISYFYFVLRTSALFTHFFYIPIILSCVWWKWRGLIVCFLLIVLSILIPLPIGFEIYLIDTIIRSFAFFAVGLVTAFLSSELSKSHENLKDRIRALKCIQGITNLLKDPNNSVEDILNESIKQIKCASQYPNQTCVKILFNEKEYITKNFRESPWQISHSVKISNKELFIYVNYLDELSFLEMEKNLIKEISEELRAVFEFKLEWL